jgi:hypothetical protein
MATRQTTKQTSDKIKISLSSDEMLEIVDKLGLLTDDEEMVDIYVVVGEQQASLLEDNPLVIEARKMYPEDTTTRRITVTVPDED